MYSDNILEFADYVRNDPEYKKLVPNSGDDFTSISISNVPEVHKVKYSMSRMSSILKNKNTVNNKYTNGLISEYDINHVKANYANINSRLVNYLISESGPNYMKAIWAHTLELKPLVQQINFHASINNPLNLDLDKILLTGPAGKDNKIILLMSKRQRDDMKLIKELLGCTTEGSVAYFCIISTIDRFASAGCGFDAKIDYRSQINSINAEVQKFAEILYPYIKAGRKYLGFMLEDHSKNTALSDNLVEHISNLLEQIDKLELDKKVMQLCQ